MKVPVPCDVALGLLCVGLVSACGCSSTNGHAVAVPGAAGAAGAATAAAGATGTRVQVQVDAGDDAIIAIDAGDTEASDASVAGDLGPFVSISVVPTRGCGQDAGQAPGATVAYTIATSGSKPADCTDTACGPWMYTRQYFLTLPVGYDQTKAYPLIFEGVGCGGTGAYVYPLDANVDNTVIRVGLTPPPSAIGHATRPNQGCFDYADGDSSVDWVFYETLYDQLAGQLCFDTNRVFVVGSASGGAPFANELGCKYAGDAKHPIRGMMATSGGLPADAPVPVTCSASPMAGMWVAQTGDTIAPFTTVETSVARAMKVNGCTIGTGYMDALFENFPIGGAGNVDSTCKRIMGCPALTPLVVCAIPGNNHSTNDAVANPGYSTFIKLLENPPLLTQ